jgi:UDP-glucose 4-epimerase
LKVLVTGGAGFIGSHLVDKLGKKNCKVTVFDDLSNGRIDNLKNHLLRGTISFIEGNILDPEKVKEAVVGSDAVVHLAAVVSVPFSVLNPKTTYEVNVYGTKLLLDQSIANGVKKFILISSCAVYGEPHYTPTDELHSTNPLSPYAESKLEAESICLKSSVNGLETVALRLFNVYGPRQTQDGYAGVISSFTERLVKGNPLTIHGDGLQTRDFVHVSDVAEAIWLTLNARSVEGIFNIASGRAVKIIELAEVMAELMDHDQTRIVFDKPREGDIRHSHGDFSKAREMLGYRPRKELRRGLKELLEEEIAKSNPMEKP